MGVGIVVLALIAIILLGYWLMRWRFQRAIRQVMTALISSGATNPFNAQTLEDLGLKSGWGIIRDYRPYVIQALLANGSLEQLDDGRLYITREACQRYASKLGMPPGSGVCQT